MTPEKLIHELLGLKWEVVESRFDRQSGTVFLEIRETAALWASVHCPKDTGQHFSFCRMGLGGPASAEGMRSFCYRSVTVVTRL